MQIKVKDTRMHETRNQCDGCNAGLPLKDGVHKDHQLMGISCTKHLYQVPVAEGKLVLIEYLNSDKGLFRKQGDSLYLLDKSKEGSNKKSSYSPIIISETEKIEVGDWYYNPTGTGIQLFADKSQQYIIERDDCKKILVFPEQLSSKHLQAILDGKMKDGDKVLVECETQRHIGDTIEEDGYVVDKETGRNQQIIKLNSQNHVTLHKVEEKMVPLSEVRRVVLAYKAQPYLNDKDFEKWFEQNVK